jgi:hypothetical protein
MKKSFLLLCTATLLFANTYGQENKSKTKVREVGFVFQNLDSYGLTYPFGNEKTLGRLSVLNLSGGGSEGDQLTYDRLGRVDGSTDKVRNFSAGLKIGFESRKRITDNFFFRSGLDIGGFYGTNKAELEALQSDIYGGITATNADRTIENWGASFEVIVGFNYTFKQKLVFGLEVLPGFQYEATKETLEYESGYEQEDEIGNVQASLGLENATLSIAYRFSK